MQPKQAATADEDAPARSDDEIDALASASLPLAPALDLGPVRRGGPIDLRPQRMNRPNPVAGRVPPHSVEAEESLLACCLIDGGDSIRAADAAGITAASFYESAHRELFTVLGEIHRNGNPVDEVVLAEELRKRGLLEAVGGVVRLNEITNRIPTTAHRAYFLEQVRDNELLRDLVTKATRATESAYACQGGAATLVAGFARELDSLATQHAARVDTAAILDSHRFDAAQPPRPARTIFTLDGKSIATPGNLVALSALPKAGKSALLGGFIAAPTGDGDTLGIGSANPEGWALVHFDTEQSPSDAHAVVATALRRTGATAPAWLRSYSVLGVPVVQRLDVLAAELRRARKACGGVHSVLLDGVADFVTDPNDPAEAFAAVERIHRLAAEFDTTIVCILHVNPGSESGKTRGHLGSQLERKAETNLRLEKDVDGITVVFCERGRHCHIPRADGHRFRWSIEPGMHMSCATARADKEQAKATELRELVADVLPIGKRLKYGALKESIMEARGCKDRTAERNIAAMRAAAVINYTDGEYEAA